MHVSQASFCSSLKRRTRVRRFPCHRSGQTGRQPWHPWPWPRQAGVRRGSGKIVLSSRFLSMMALAVLVDDILRSFDFRHRNHDHIRVAASPGAITEAAGVIETSRPAGRPMWANIAFAHHFQIRALAQSTLEHGRTLPSSWSRPRAAPAACVPFPPEPEAAESLFSLRPGIRTACSGTAEGGSGTSSTWGSGCAGEAASREKSASASATGRCGAVLGAAATDSPSTVPRVLSVLNAVTNRVSASRKRRDGVLRLRPSPSALPRRRAENRCRPGPESWRNASRQKKHQNEGQRIRRRHDRT